MHIQSFINSRGHRSKLTALGVAALTASLACVAVLPAAAATLDRIKESGHIKIGYFVDASPFSKKSAAGGAEGYAITLCQGVADKAKSQLGLATLAVDWVPVTVENHLLQVKDGSIDLLCAPISATAAKRKDVAFSIPIFAGGVRAVMNKDAATALRNAMAETPTAHPVWRGTPAAKLLDKKTFAVVKSTTTEKWLAGKIKSFQIEAKTEPVADYRTGLQQLSDHKVDVFFGERSLILGAMDASQRSNLVISERLLTHEPLALVLPRGDEDFRLLVDSTLSDTFASEKFGELYKKWCGAFDDMTRTFFSWNTLAQ
jgi:ABC-type amino acid transport substrate-binding protein